MAIFVENKLRTPKVRYLCLSQSGSRKVVLNAWKVPETRLSHANRAKVVKMHLYCLPATCFPLFSHLPLDETVWEKLCLSSSCLCPKSVFVRSETVVSGLDVPIQILTDSKVLSPARSNDLLHQLASRYCIRFWVHFKRIYSVFWGPPAKKKIYLSCKESPDPLKYDILGPNKNKTTFLRHFVRIFRE